MASVTVPTYTKSGTKATTTAKLDAGVFGALPENHELLKLAYVAYLANGRENLAVTKTRGLIRGGGRKPWKQKGTGRARFGSSRNPIWRGGGIVFGPTGEENYTKKMNLSAKRLAIRQALSLAASEDRIRVIESFDNKDAKVAATAQLLDKIGVSGSVLLVVANKTDEVVRATRNLKTLTVVAATYVNVYDVMNSDAIVIESEALAAINEWLSATRSTSGGKK